jgi:hypothetical protein
VTQTKIRIARPERTSKYDAEFAEAVGLSYQDDVITLRFLDSSKWGKPARQVRLDRSVAEQLSRLLNYELEYADWPE